MITRTRTSKVARVAATMVLAGSLLAGATGGVAARDEPPGPKGMPATAEQIRELVRKQRERVLARIEAAFTGETATGRQSQLELIQAQRERVLAHIEDVFAANEAAAAAEPDQAAQAEPAEPEVTESEGGEAEDGEPEGAEAEDGEAEDGEPEGDEGAGGEGGEDEGEEDEDVLELPDTGVGSAAGTSGLVPALMGLLAALIAIGAGRRRFRWG